SLSLTGVRLIIPDHAMGLPVLRALSLCTCCRHYPGAAAGRSLRSSHPAISAFPGRGAGSACTSTFSRIAQRSLALRPAHSRGHQFVTRYPKASDISLPPCLLRLLPAGAVAGWGLHPLENAALARRTAKAVICPTCSEYAARPLLTQAVAIGDCHGQELNRRNLHDPALSPAQFEPWPRGLAVARRQTKGLQNGIPDWKSVSL